MNTTNVELAERGRSPLGAHIRFLIDGPHGNMIHSTMSVTVRLERRLESNPYWHKPWSKGARFPWS